MGDVMASYLAKLTGNQYTTNLTTTLNANSYGCNGGSFGEQLLGSLFNVAAMTTCYAAQAGCFGGGGSSSQSTQQVAQLTTIVGAYVDADKNLDTAKENMQTALTELQGLKDKLADINSAQTNLDAAKSEMSNLRSTYGTNGSDPQSVTEYKSKMKEYESATADFKKYTEYKSKADSSKAQADQIKDTNIGKINVTGDGATATASLIQNAGEFKTNDENGKLQLKGNGNDVALVNSTNFTITIKGKDGKTETMSSGERKQAALTQAQKNDESYKANQALAEQYNTLMTEYKENSQKAAELNDKHGVNFENPDAQSAIERLKPEDNTLLLYKDDANIGPPIKKSTYVNKQNAIQSKIDKNTQLLGDDNGATNRAAVQKEIDAKKTEITTKQKPALETAQKAFDKAAADVAEIQTEIASLKVESDKVDVQKGTADAQNKARKHKGGVLNPGNWFRKKTGEQKAYQTANNQFKENQATFTQEYGANYKDAAKVIADAETKVKEIDISLGTIDYNDL